MMDTNCRRFKREYVTLQAMARLYCIALHKGGKDRLCPECVDFLAYARVRIEHCTFGEDKPACAVCPVHCYKPEQRGQARTIMRHAGPRMLLNHPLLTVLHYWDRSQSSSRVRSWKEARRAKREKK